MPTKSLYERLGGYDAIAAVTDDLLARLLNDPQLGAFWKGHSENSLRRDRQLVVNFMCEAAGGPDQSPGRRCRASLVQCQRAFKVCCTNSLCPLFPQGPDGVQGGRDAGRPAEG